MSMTEATHREVQRSDHTTIRYTTCGRPDGPTAVLIHGWTCNRTDFDAVARHLSAECRTIAVDLAEHGESRSTRQIFSIEEFALDVAAVIEAESVNRCLAVGHSLGAAVAVELARLLPETVTRVVGLDGLHYTFLFGGMDDDQATGLLKPLHEDFAGLVRSMVEAGSPPNTDPALKDAYFEKMVAVRQPAGTLAFEGLVRWNMEDALRATTQPITVFGVRELISQDAVDNLGTRVRIEPVDLGTHHFPVESPRETANLIASLAVTVT